MNTTSIKAEILQLNRAEQADIARFIIDLMAETNEELLAIKEQEKERATMKEELTEAFKEVKYLKENKQDRVSLNEFLNEC